MFLGLEARWRPGVNMYNEYRCNRYLGIEATVMEKRERERLTNDATSSQILLLIAKERKMDQEERLGRNRTK